MHLTQPGLLIIWHEIDVLKLMVSFTIQLQHVTFTYMYHSSNLHKGSGFNQISNLHWQDITYTYYEYF